MWSILSSQSFYAPPFTLSGHVPVSNNRPDFYKQPQGISIVEDQGFLLDAMNARLEYVVDSENGYVLIYIRNGKHQLTYPIYVSFETYLDNMFAAVWEKELEKMRIQNLNARRTTTGTGLIPELVMNIPAAAMPKTMRRIMGSQTARLNITGSQRATISVSRTVRETNLVTEFGSNANFDIIMRQDLNLNVRGTIGDKITVNVKYNSNQETNLFDPNNVHIMYKGDEDEIVQSIEAGNVSLSLSGSRYISVSASSQGLFGVKANLKLGDLSMTVIASKEEAQKNTRTFRGGSQADSSVVQSRNFSKRTRYFIDDPRLLYAMHREGDTLPNGNPIPIGWVDNAIRTDAHGAWLMTELGASRLPRSGTFFVYIDESNSATHDYADRGRLIMPDDSYSEIEYYFLPMMEDHDYVMDYTSGIIRFNRPLNPRHTIGVAYIDMAGNVIGDISDRYNLRLKPIKMSNQSIASHTWIYELRNVYDLGMSGIRNDGFALDIFTNNPDGTRNYYVTGDSTALGWLLTDYLRMDTNQNGLINGDDATVDLTNGLVNLPFINPFFALGDSAMYKVDRFAYDSEFIHYFSIKGQIGRDQVNLGMMILPGSVRVRINGRERVENIDYIVDYDFGAVTFLTPDGRDPSSEIEINYENRPMFAIESKTLLGVRADWRPWDFLRLGGTVIYQSENITDKRPRIGNESRSLVLANIDGEVRVDAPFLTTAVDFIPLINTDARSTISLSGEIAMNAPYIHGSDTFGDGNEAWIDDMESVLDSYPLGIMRPTWVPASEPFDTNLVKARVNWFNPNNVYARDVYPPYTLSDKEKFETINVLDLKIIPPPIYTPGVSTPLWGGLMKYIGNQVDFSQKEYIEFLVKVDSLDTRYHEVKFHLDMGLVSEDFYTENGNRGVLNTEDGVVTGFKTGRFDARNDIGLSGIPWGEPGHNPWDFFCPKEVNGEFPFINGTIGNGVLDTEDLNGNGILDTREVILRYQVSLSDPNSPFLLSEFNGWKLYRIPLANNPHMQSLSDSNRDAASLDAISYVRMWYQTEGLTKIRLVYLDIVGNKWKKMAIKERADLAETNVPATTIAQNNSFLSIETSDNQKSSKYVSPPGTTERGRDGDISYEQSLLVNYHNIQPGHISLAFQNFREAMNLLSYNKLRYWVYLESHPDSPFSPDSLYVIFRVGADTLNYYEVLKPLRVNPYQSRMSESNWVEIEVCYTELTFLKTIETDRDSVSYTRDGTVYRKIRNPTLSNIRSLAIGIQVPPHSHAYTGAVYFNDIRVAEPNQNVGYAARATFDTRFADFATLRMDYEWRTSDFYTSTSRTMTAATNLEDKVTFNVTNNYNLDKFFPSGWGMRLPLNLSQTQSLGIPKYKANSDILRTVLSPEDQDREQNKSFSRQADTSFSLNRTPRNKFLAYTIRNVTMGANIRETQTITSTRADSVITWRYNGAYNLNIPTESIRLRLFKDYHWFYMPKTFNNSATVRGEFPKRWDWNLAEGEWRPRGQSINHANRSPNTKSLETSNEIRYDIFSDMNATYKLDTRRDLMTEQHFKSINIGQETERRQDINLQYTPFYMASFATTTITAGANYRENRRQFRPTGAEPGEFDYNFEGNVSTSIRTTVILRNSVFFTNLANKAGAASNRRFAANERESGQGFASLDSYMDEKFDGSWYDVGKDDIRFDGTFFDRDHDKDTFDPRKEDLEREREREREREKERDEKFEREHEDREGGTDREREPSRERKPNTLLPDFLGILARVQNINLTYDNQRGSRYSQRDDRPEFLYQLGIPNILSTDELDQWNENDNFSLSSGFPIIRNLQADFRYSYGVQRGFSPHSRNKSITTVWPDARLTLAGFETLIKADRWLSNSRLQTNYSFSEKHNFDTNSWSTPISEQYEHRFAPLLQWNGNWVNKVNTSFSVNLNLSEHITNHPNNTMYRNTQRVAYSGTAGYSFRGDHGIKFPFVRRKLYFQNDLSTDLNVSYETENRSAKSGEARRLVEADLYKISISPRVTYNLHTNIKCGLTSAYDLSKDKITNIKINIFRLDFWVEFIF
jgi:hypothetical protein